VYNGRGNWVNVLEEAWEAIGRDPPPIWNVIIQELPEERDERKSVLFRENQPRRINENTLLRKHFKIIVPSDA